MAEVELTLVAGRRPALLERTLASFADRLFPALAITRALVNIDPIFGDAADHDRCRAILRAHFEDLVVFEPETAGFGAAVKRLWQATRAPYVLHLEDDWVALERIDRSVLAPFADPRIRQVSLHTADQNWDVRRKGHLHRRRVYVRLAGWKTPFFRWRGKFTTAPSILEGGFARRAAALMDPALDPEKQFFSGHNPKLEAATAGFRHHIFSPDGTPVIRDTGRDWRIERGIDKRTVDGASVWTRRD
ncbi:hypothetical protein N1F89_11740 [Aquibium sp. A9E412]|uniref:hypothetical protein n=1 Tax=Aquibium sp. A9E412 TaxID=2976767 RepID=UPI0025AEF9C2|nr:hypothetical protein [Aquibium sp. A9E412]MDN2566897.1 hypothetical protein [Aquibium sp. A9E412]